VDHRPSVSDLGANGKERESDRTKLEALARVARKLHQKAAFHGLCKAAYLRKVSDFNWGASKAGPGPPGRGLDVLPAIRHFSRFCGNQEAVSADPEG
jgi:hypothetical protein